MRWFNSIHSVSSFCWHSFFLLCSYCKRIFFIDFIIIFLPVFIFFSFSPHCYSFYQFHFSSFFSSLFIMCLNVHLSTSFTCISVQIASCFHKNHFEVRITIPDECQNNPNMLRKMCFVFTFKLKASFYHKFNEIFLTHIYCFQTKCSFQRRPWYYK